MFWRNLYGGLLNQPKSLPCRDDSVQIGSQFDDTLRDRRCWYTTTSLFDLQEMRLRGNSAIRQASKSIWLHITHTTCGLKLHCLFGLWTLHLYCNTNTCPVWCLMLLGVSKINWQQRGSHQGSSYKWQKCTWKQQSRHCSGSVCEVNREKKGLGGEHLDESVDLYLCAALYASQVHDSLGILMCNLEWHPSQKCFHVAPAFYDSMQYQLDVTLEGIWPYGCQFSCTSKKRLSVLWPLAESVPSRLGTLNEMSYSR